MTRIEFEHTRDRWMSREEALAAKGKYGKAFNGYQFSYGKVLDVHSSGEYLQFQGANRAPRWFSRKDVTLHAHQPDHSQT